MIFVMLGTNPYCFSRLIEAVDEYAEKTGEKIIMQLGFSTIMPKYATYFRFKPHPEIIRLIREAELLIMQGGYGSIFDGLSQHKRIIAVPRKLELQEATDGGLGQLELVEELERKHRLIGLYDVNRLEQTIEIARHFVPDFSVSNELPGYVSGLLQQASKSLQPPKKPGYNILANLFPLFFKNRLTEMTYFVTDKCNFRCKHCFLLDKLNVKQTTFLSPGEVSEMGKHIHSMQRVHIGGGEPMTRHDIADITLVIANEWNTQTICLPTNGSLQKNAVATADRFGRESSKYLRFHFSLNQTGKEMDDFSCHKNAFSLWDKTVKSVKEITAKFPNISLTVLTTFNDYNQEKFSELVHYVNHEVKPDDFSFSLVREHKDYHPELDVGKFEEENHKMHFSGRNHGAFIRAYREIIREKIAEYHRNPGYRVPCQSGKLRVVMSPEGDIFPCEHLGYPEGPEQEKWFMGNIRDYDYNIHALLQSPVALQVRRKIVLSKCHCCHGVDMSLSYQATFKFKAEVAWRGIKYWLGLGKQKDNG
jgi:radical SAM protein with 4Fe4S-binding SPASM domain